MSGSTGLKEPTPPQAEATDPQAPSVQPPLRCDPFSEAVLDRQLLFDGLARWSALVLILALVLIDPLVSVSGAFSSTVLIMLVIGYWTLLSLTDARVASRLPIITALIEQDPQHAQEQLALAMRRRPLHRALRLLLYHRLAVLRHGERQYDQCAMICHALLSRRLGSADHVRPHLLLMFAECRLAAGDLFGAYDAIRQLHQLKLALVERLQLVALQTRYEVAVGHDAAALEQLDGKLRLVELMPTPQCGATHRLLATAATRLGRTELAHWLCQRAELLGPTGNAEAVG